MEKGREVESEISFPGWLRVWWRGKREEEKRGGRETKFVRQNCETKFMRQNL